MVDLNWWDIVLHIVSVVIFLGVVSDGYWPVDDLRNLGMYVIAYKGTGKSRLIGRHICLADLRRGIPQLVIDGLGGLIANVLDAVMRLPAPQRREALSRLVYFDMSGKLTGRVCPMPLFYRLGGESWNDIGSRPLNTTISLDSYMRQAPIMGANQFKAIGLPLHQILAASGWQITEARLLLDQPKLFKNHLQALKAATEDLVLRAACDWFLSNYMGWDSKKRSQDTMSYRRKLDLLLRDNATIAMFGAHDQNFLRFVEEQGLTVLLDFSGDQQNPELMQFKMNWMADQALNFVKQRVEDRGPGLHLKPFGIVIDELAMLTNFDATSGSEVDVFAAKLGEILDQYGRQGKIFFVGAMQEQYQVSPALFKTLMGSGIVVCGLTSDWQAALTMAEAFLPAQPGRVKRYEPIYRPDDTIRAYRQVDMTLEEQQYKTAALFMRLKKFQFLVKEYGQPQVWLLDTTDLDVGLYPDPERVKDLKVMLNERWAIPIPDILANLERRHAAILSGDVTLPEPQVKSGLRSATLEADEQHPTDDAATNLPPATGADDDFWQER